MNATSRFIIDIVERALASFFLTFASTYATGIQTELGFVACFQISFGAAVGSVLKGLTAGAIGAKGTAALLPASADAVTAATKPVTGLVDVLTEPIPGAKQVGDVVEHTVEVTTDALQDAAVAGAKAVEGGVTAVTEGLGGIVNKIRGRRP